MAVSLESLVARQKNLQNVLDNLMEGIIAHDLGRKVLFFNRAAEKITGYSREEVLGRDCHSILRKPMQLLRSTPRFSGPSHLRDKCGYTGGRFSPDRDVGNGHGR
jgi:PAS domain-containing protein